MIRWAVRGALGIVVVVALATAVGGMLPVAHTASRSALVATSPARAHALLAHVAGYPRWWSEVSRVDVLPPVGGRPRFRQHLSTGAVVFEIVQSIPAARVVSRIADPDQPFGGTWTVVLAPEAGGTRVTTTEDGEVYNPLFRFLSHYVFSQTATMESCLAALAAVDGIK